MGPGGRSLLPGNLPAPRPLAYPPCMTLARVPYVLVQHAVRAATPLVGRSASRTARALRGRLAAARSLSSWGMAHRDAGRPGVWLHAPSVGEALVARAVAEAVAARRRGTQCVFTHFSPSVEPWRERMGADWAGYLPWDVPGEMAAALDAVRPDALVFTRTEAWPVLVATARERGVPVAMAGGIVPPDSRRGRWWARPLLRPTWRAFALVCAAGEADAEGFARLGVPPGVIRVTGDPGVDSAAARAGGPEVAEPWLRALTDEGRPTLVAGSTWPSDVRVLLPALDGLRRSVPGLRLVVAPHEPSDGAVRGLLAELFGRGWRAATLGEVSEAGAGDVDAVVVERMGVLARLYRAATVAYVGGGFRGSGLHSVLEPAAAGAPVVFGPAGARSRAAEELEAAGGGRRVSTGEELAEALGTWLGDAAAHAYARTRASGYIHAHRGAADRTAALLDELLPSPSHRP